jgi:hypothetical protein
MISVCSLSAQSVIFTAEVDQLVIGPATIDQTNSEALNLNAVGFFVASADFESFSSNSVWSNAQTSLNMENLGAVVDFIESQAGFGQSAIIQRVPTAAPDSFGIFNGEIQAQGVGFHAVFLVHDSNSGLGGLGIGNNFGVVTTTYTTQELLAEAIGFNTSNSWDTFLLGDSGSLVLSTVVPEPSASAVIAGLLGLSFVMVRRRRA